MQLTMSNMRPRSHNLWVHLVSVWVISLFTLWVSAPAPTWLSDLPASSAASAASGRGISAAGAHQLMQRACMHKVLPPGI